MSFSSSEVIFRASSSVWRICFQWLPTQYVFPHPALLHLQNRSYSSRLLAGTALDASPLLISRSSAPHSGHLVADISVSREIPSVLVNCTSRASSVSPRTRTDRIFLPRARLYSSSSRVNRTIPGFSELRSRLLSSAFESYSVTYPSILSHRARPPSIPSTTNLNSKIHVSIQSQTLLWRRSLPLCRRSYPRQW